MSASASAAAQRADALTAGGLFVLTLGALDFGLEQSIIVPALPQLAVHYHASAIAIAWLATGFLLAATVGIPLLGRLGDLYGKRRLLLVCLTAFALGSLLCALASSIGLAIAGRVVQGAGAAVAPLTLGLARDMVPPHLLSRAIGVVVGAANIGGAIGFLVGGLLVDRFSPAAIFWFLFAFGVALAVGVFATVGESPHRTRLPLDLVGTALLAGGLVALLLAISKGETWGCSSASVVGLFVASAVLFAGFALVERRVRRPLLDLRLVSRRPFLNANACALTFGFAFFLAAYLLPQIAAAPTGYGLGLSTTQIGLMLLPTSAAGFAAGWLSGRVVDRVGPAALVVTASTLGIAAYIVLAASHDTVAALVLGSAAVGVGWGTIPSSFYAVVLRRADADKASVSVSVPLVFRNIGASLGVTIAFVVVSSSSADDAFVRGFIFAAAATALAFVAGLFLPRPRPSSQ